MCAHACASDNGRTSCHWSAETIDLAHVQSRAQRRSHLGLVPCRRGRRPNSMQGQTARRERMKYPTKEECDDGRGRGHIGNIESCGRERMGGVSK